jgi:SAM-dependent methyltransferase
MGKQGRQLTRGEWADRGISLHERIEDEREHWGQWALRQAVEVPGFPFPVRIGEDVKRTFPYPVEKWGYRYHMGRILGGLDWREKRVLQLGGSGGQAVRFAIAGSHPAFAIDPSLEMLELAAERAQAYGVQNSVSVVQAIAEDMPFPDNFFDIVYAGFVLHHTILEKSAPEIYRVLKPGGRFCFVEPFEGNSLFRLFRVIVPYPGKDKRTSTYEYPTRPKDLHLLATVFDGHDYLYFGIFMALTEYLVRLIGSPTLGRRLNNMLQTADYLITKRVRILKRLCLRVGGKLSKKPA